VQKFPARSALTRVQSFISESSDRIAFVLISSEVQLGIGVLQSVCRPRIVSGFVRPEGLLKDYYYRECAESKDFNSLK
jgi:hypothetical protein